jgi:predicted signal transduction protein with EAL and GGDEF domain/ABC-type amino acid transport substrate-binding protein
MEVGQAEETDTVVFGGSAYYPPFEWLDDDGRPRGFLIDLKDAIAERGGRRPVHRLAPWLESIEALDGGGVDVVPMFHSDARARKYLFTEPFYYVMHAIFGPPDARGVTGPESLEGARVAVVDEGYAQTRLQKAVIGATLMPRASIVEALRAVVDGEADFALVARPTAVRFIEDHDFNLNMLGPPFWPRRYVFAVSREYPALLDWVKENLRSVTAEGRYYELYAQWKGELEWSRPGWWDRVRPVSLILVPLVVLAVLGYLWSWLLHRRVAAGTRELRGELKRRQAAEDELRYRVRHDALTQLPTRGEFVRLSERALADRRGRDGSGLIAAVKLVELDQIILAFGYETGEQLLAEFGRRLGGMGFEVVGDLGRGVFGILVMGNVPPDRILHELTAPVDLGQLELDPHFSTGVVRYPDHGTVVAELLRKAETALAEASGHSRALVEYATAMEPDPNDLLIVRDFRRLGADDIYAEFQPLVDLGTMRMVGAEALVRWRHPEFGLIGPDRFIPLLEQAGVIGRVTEHMIREAAGLGRELSGRGMSLPVNVNISAVDMLEGDLQRLIERALDEYGIGPEALRVEMTETSVIEDPDRVGEVVAGLGRMGVKCGIDDFGAGYSSLSYLSAFPIHEVKIDRSFVTDMRTNSRHGAIVRSTIALAHQLGLVVVAEGVEDWETVAALKDFGCDRAQGFVFSRPVTAEDIVALGARVFEPG